VSALGTLNIICHLESHFTILRKSRAKDYSALELPIITWTASADEVLRV
jgi:hypothetical protein